MLAAASVGDDGSVEENADVNLEGWPLVLSALSGDEVARGAVDFKLDALLLDERARSERQSKAGDENASSILEFGDKEVEPIPLEQIAMIHSTPYDIVRDDDGDVVLHPTGHFRDGNIPVSRASLHLTLNSRVYSHAQAQGAWGSKDKLIVASTKGDDRCQ